MILLPFLNAVAVVLIHQNQEPLNNIIQDTPTDVARSPNQSRLPLPPFGVQDLHDARFAAAFIEPLWQFGKNRMSRNFGESSYVFPIHHSDAIF
ncbi:MAG: hypothetical protein H7Z41_09310 [Cytophagales bacterium]|nr:hypothetical protein [Armatimonadota bacterium]